MKNFKFYLAFVAVAAMFTTSCSKDNNPDGPDGPTEGTTSSLSFEVFLEDFEDERAAQTKNHILGEGEVPSCENEDTVPSFIRAVIAIGDENSNNYVDDGDGSNAEAVDIDIIPVDDNDNDGDGMPNWLTYEESFLELEDGEYTIIYFDVRNAAGEILYMAPSSNDNYGPANFENFVENPLPQSVQLENGTKTYVELEVLCYDEVFAQEYGYLFFDFEMLPLQYICIFGNECTDEGRHYPSNFMIKVWEYPANSDLGNVTFNEDDAFVVASNDAVWSGEGENAVVTQASPLCIALPDREGQVFYAELYTLDSPGDTEGTLIRRGDFTATEIDELYDPETEQYNYWHFREGGEYCGEDSDPCLLGSVVNESEDFNNAESFGDVTIGGTEYAWSETTGEDPYGTYNIVTNAQEFYSGFPSLLDADNDSNGKFVVFDGDDLEPNETFRRVYFSENIPTVCEGDVYYITMDLVDISTPNEGDGGNDAQLEITANGAQIALFEISDLAGYDTWTKVGFILMADGSGNIDFEISDPDGNWEGNDFGMDNINISNDPTSLNDVDHINPGI